MLHLFYHHSADCYSPRCVNVFICSNSISSLIIILVFLSYYIYFHVSFFLRLVLQRSFDYKSFSFVSQLPVLCYELFKLFVFCFDEVYRCFEIAWMFFFSYSLPFVFFRFLIPLCVSASYILSIVFRFLSKINS